MRHLAPGEYTGGDVPPARRRLFCNCSAVSRNSYRMPDPAELTNEDLERYRPFLTVLVRMRLGARYQSKLSESDLVQQTLLDAHSRWHQFRGNNHAELAGWLRQILAGNLADAYRAFGRAKRDVSRERSIEAGIDESCTRLQVWLQSMQTSPSMKAAKNEQLLRLAWALGELPPDQRDAVELHHLQGLTLAEVAAKLGRTHASVAGLLRRGLKALRGLLQEDGLSHE